MVSGASYNVAEGVLALVGVCCLGVWVVGALKFI